MLTPENAMRQASMTADEYAMQAVINLCARLDIDRTKPDWREQLAPFADVLAAMIMASAKDYDTSIRHFVT